LLVVLAILLFFSGQADNGSFDGPKSSVESAASPVMAYLTMPIRGFENVMEDIRGRSQAHQENKALKLEVARLSDAESRANSLAIKLAGLEKILNVDATSDIPTKRIAARAVAETNGPFVRTALLNVGQVNGIRSGYPVMTVDGLMGHISRVGKNSSRVLRLEDLNSRIAVMSVRSQSRAILTGDNSAYPKLSFLTEVSDWQEGDVVVTSGDDGAMPTGLPIGYVKLDENNDMFVVLNVNQSHADWVWVYAYDPPKAPEDDPVEIEPAPDASAETTPETPQPDQSNIEVQP
jgi:rod shape-determining protein MreC